MKIPSIPLPKLPNLGALLRRRGGGGMRLPPVLAGLVARLRGLPLPPAFPAAVLMVVGITIGAVLWLWMNTDDTLKLRAEAVQRITVPITGGAAPAAKAEPGKTAPAASDHAPGEVPKGGAPSADPAVVLGPGPDEAFPLAKAPAQGMTEESRNGLLPAIAADGSQAWQVYGRPFAKGDKRGRIAIIIGQMGLAGAATGLAMQRLPPGVTLAFVPIADRLEGWIEAARSQGHEVLLSVPMEPLSYPHDDPGPNTLLLALDAAHNVDRFEWALGRFAGYVGVISPTGSRFSAEPNALRPILETVKKRGIAWVDARTTPYSVGDLLAVDLGLPRAHVDRIIDQDPSRGGIDTALAALEAIAAEEGAAVGYGEPYPTTLERVLKWVPLLPDKKLILAPLSAVINLQKPPPPPPARPDEKH
ncbi:MAG: divergent polysaccharide deacetylase family protein [Rhodospirillaceae bacterium]